jgi:hypothetical protein
MKLITKIDVDFIKWDKIVSSSPKNNAMCYSWYLNATADNWSAIITDDYSFITLCFRASLKLMLKEFLRKMKMFIPLKFQTTLKVLLSSTKTIHIKN